MRPPHLTRRPPKVPAVLLTCPNCRSGLQVPDGTAAMVRCPACGNVFASAPEEVEEPVPPPARAPRPKTTTLTCPNCRSGLEVPSGTSALVRCPACQNVFSPEDGTPDELEEEPAPQPRARRRAPAEDEDEKPRTKRRTRRADEDDEDEEKKPRNRDFDPITEEEDRERRRKKRRVVVDDLTPEEKAERRRAFDRAAWGARLIAISLALFMISMLFITGYFFQSAFGAAQGWIVTIAGFMGLLNWVCAAIGVGLCLSGPRAPGHWGYGIAAATAVLVHFIFLGAVVSQGKEFGIAKDEEGLRSVRWSMLPTRLNATMFYLTALAYPDEQGITPRGRMLLSMVTGVAEMVRTVLIMMLLSCLSRAALDEELAGRCTRTAGIVSGGPGLLALVVFFFVAFFIETNAGLNMFTLILFTTMQMGIYSIISGVTLPAFMAAQDVTDACEEPFQSLIPNL